MDEVNVPREEERTPQTVRQRIMRELEGTFRTSRQLAGLLGISEKKIEEHLPYIVKSLAHKKWQTFLIDPATCLDCQFNFRDRRRLTKPSRCPQCRSEAITAPQFGIKSLNNDKS